MTPSVGRIVHYVSYGTPKGEHPGGVCRAAVVTATDGGRLVHLAVLNPSGLFFDQDVPRGEPGEGGTWHEPERIGEA